MSEKSLKPLAEKPPRKAKSRREGGRKERGKNFSQRGERADSQAEPKDLLVSGDLQEASTVFDSEVEPLAPDNHEVAGDRAIEVASEGFVDATQHIPQEVGTVREERIRLRNAVEEMQDLEERKREMEDVQKEYFKALEGRFQKQGGIETVSSQFFNTSNNGSKELEQLREQWIQARAGFAGAQRESVEARLKADPSNARNMLLEKLRQKYGEGSERADLLGRYERIVTAGSVVIGQEEAEQKIKEAGLSKREKGSFDSVLGWYKGLPPGVRVLGTSALMFGAGAAIAGTPAGWAALGLGGGAALMRWAAEAQKGPKTKAAFGFLSRIASVGGIAGFVSEAVVTGTHSILKTEEKAEAKLKKREGLGDLSNPENLARISTERRKATVIEDSIKRQGRLARMVGSLTGGWLFGSAMGGDNSAPEVSAGNAPAPDAAVEVAERNIVESTPEAVAQPPQPLNVTENTPSVPTAPEVAPAVEPIVATIEAGEGFNKLILDLRGSVDDRLHGMQQDSSPVMKYLLETSPTELSDRIGAFDPSTGESMVMQAGDKLYLDDKGDLYFERVGEEARLVIGNDPSSPEGFKVEELKDFDMQSTSTTQTPSSFAEERNEVNEASLDPEPQGVVAEETAPLSVEESISVANEGSAPTESTPQIETSELPRSDGPRTIEDSLRELEGVGVEAPQAQTIVPEEPVDSSFRTIEDSIRESGNVGEQPHVNIHDVEVSPSEPAPYEWKVPGTNETYTAVYGGSPEQTQVWIQRELELQPTARILVNESYINPDTGAPATRVNEWFIDQEGKPAVVEGVTNNTTGIALPPITEDDLIRKLF